MSESISELESSIALREGVSKEVGVSHTILSNTASEVQFASETVEFTRFSSSRMKLLRSVA